MQQIFRGDLNSCPNGHKSEISDLPRPAARIGPERPKSDDEDYYDENKKVEDIMEDVGDADILICDNLVILRAPTVSLYGTRSSVVSAL